jgi:hypothetical protein
LAISTGPISPPQRDKDVGCGGEQEEGDNGGHNERLLKVSLLVTVNGVNSGDTAITFMTLSNAPMMIQGTGDAERCSWDPVTNRGGVRGGKSRATRQKVSEADQVGESNLAPSKCRSLAAHGIY